MSYLQKNLISGEKIIQSVTYHWYAHFWGIILLVIGTVFYINPIIGYRLVVSAGTSLGMPTPKDYDADFIYTWLVNPPIYLLLIIGFLKTFSSIINRLGTIFVLTNDRILVKFGLISRDTLEFNSHETVSIMVEQSIIGRLLNFGTITVKGPSGMNATIDTTLDPFTFRKAAQETFSKRINIKNDIIHSSG